MSYRSGGDLSPLTSAKVTKAWSIIWVGVVRNCLATSVIQSLYSCLHFRATSALRGPGSPFCEIAFFAMTVPMLKVVSPRKSSGGRATIIYRHSPISHHYFHFILSRKTINTAIALS
jgi:hypothetical protein